jgi:hypothetical protein
MKRNLLLIIACIVLGMSLFSGQSLAVCPEDTLDSGECDTLYVEVLPGDEILEGLIDILVRFPIFVTHDVPDSSLDSIAAFVIPLCYTSSNQYANAVIDPAWNNTDLYPFPTTDGSIFRHLDYDGHHLTNWMMALSEQLIGLEWDTRILDISEGDNFWFATFPTGSQYQKFPEGSRTLRATITFTLEDTTTICIDSCFMPPASRLTFTRSDAKTYFPRHNLPVCQRIKIYGPPPYFTTCPHDETHAHNYPGYQSSPFVAEYQDGPIISVTTYLTGSGVENVMVEYTMPPPSAIVEGYIRYDVVDHCQPGGTVDLTAWYDVGQGWSNCSFDITLTNDPPFFSLSDTWFALAGYTMLLLVPAAIDINADSVGPVEFDALWYEPDSLQPPTNAPSYESGDPGLFTWALAAADTGTWICLFSATDECGDSYARQISIEVGLPFCGDCTDEGEISVSDIVCLCSYLFRNGPAPAPLCKGDANCNGDVEAGDMVYLINYFFRYGPAPCFDCCP